MVKNKKPSWSEMQKIKKKQKNKNKARDLDSIISKTKKLIVEENEHDSRLPDEIEKALADIPTPPKNILINSDDDDKESTGGLSEISDIYEGQNRSVVDAIGRLEIILKEYQEDHHKLVKEEIGLSSERELLKALNLIDQDMIDTSEQKLLIIDKSNYSYQADDLIPTIMLKLIEKLTGRPHESLVLREIAVRAFKVDNRSQQVNKLDERLTDVSLAVVYYDNIIETLRTTVDNYRELRLLIGQQFRFLRNQIQQHQQKLDAEQIFNFFAQNVGKINSVGDIFRQKMFAAKQNASEKLVEFDKFQKDMLLNPTFSLEIDPVVNEVKEVTEVKEVKKS